ncbi:MAG: 50S ribosomal protein L13 [Candidatus Omnitrophica bacterium]|nr:50S ribosomal protein L13 [Candidatus Omnitrophota bacterium]
MLNKAKTYTPNVNDIKRGWFIIDAKGKILGKLATKAAVYLQGKNKTDYTPYIDGGDEVIVVNAEKIVVTGKKLEQKMYKRYSGYPGGLKETPLEEMLKRKPEEVIRLAVKGMLPKNRLGSRMIVRLKVYKGEAHPHKSQKPVPLEI